jgi:hypothetical protein
MHLPAKALVITGAAIAVLGGGSAALATIHPAAAPVATSPGEVISMTQYQPDSAPEASATAWAFLGSPPLQRFLSQHTAAQVTATVTEAVVEGAPIQGTLGICYEQSGSSSVTNTTYIEYGEPTTIGVTQLPFTVSGVVGNLPAGKYLVGLCAEDQQNTSNETASVSIVLAQTRAGVTYAQPPKG